MFTNLESLCSDIDEIVVLLRTHNLPGWASVLEKGASEIRNSDFHGVMRILHCYGGMGSLNDIIIYENDGDLFETLRTRIYQKANAIRKYQDLVLCPGFRPLD